LFPVYSERNLIFKSENNCRVGIVDLLASKNQINPLRPGLEAKVFEKQNNRRQRRMNK
jgi:hypothetical protein